VNKREIMALPAGRKLDEMVAKAFEIPGVRIEDGTWGAEGPMWRYSGGYRQEFNPSTDIAAAWAVVEALEKMGWEYGILAERILTGPGHRCVFRKHGGPNLEGVAETAPMAISIAALAVSRYGK
jgi:hypothetical protein